ncbi:MAG: regulatory protein RecX [Heliobacteriaceae bacterium]|nr:regulatory protein RecX [Heliobacteriaceae bacterium]MDD4587887.1 regulatory protein RecX [Heliobacteriaceae bacterium]
MARQRESSDLSVREGMQKALGWLARRSFSSGEIALRLRSAGAGEATVTAVLAWLGERGYVDDGRFARSYALYRKETTLLGSLRLVLDLVRRGIAAAEAREVVREVLAPEEEYARARQVAIKKLRGLPPGDDLGYRRAKLGRHLQQKGFPLPLIYQLMAEMVAEDER